MATQTSRSLRRLRPVLALAAGAALCAPALAQDGAPDLAAEMVRDHNQVRAGLGLPPVAWDAELARHAQGWADELAGEHALRHSPRASRPGEGENLAAIYGGRASATQLFSGWVDERAQFAGTPLDCTDLAGLTKTGHYTQIIWKSTRRIGCAVAYAGDSQVLVCRYAPPGNICGRTPY